MQEDKQPRFDIFIQNRIKEEGLEKPSTNFTKSVIAKIETQKGYSRVLDYKPLISNRVWYAVAVLVISIFSYLIYGNSAIEINWLPDVNVQQFEQLNLMDRLPNFSVSNIYVYAFVGLAFFVGLQVYLLKKHFDSRYNLG
ncbi:MAG: hypothetical protein GY931_04560 [Maribacter sp.]|nr:hypothetical protein [Maribacter sp.]